MPVPDYLILKPHYLGRRLPKRTKIDYTQSRNQLPAHYGPRELPRLPTYTGVVPMRETDIYNTALQFRYHEFRFWALENIGTNITTAVCRNCEILENTVAARISHQKQHGCTTTLVDAYKLLLRGNPMYCVTCAVPTSKHKFGVPICDKDECMQKWLFTPQPDALTQALALSAKGVG